MIVASLTCIIIAFIWKYPEIVKASSNRIDNKLGEYIYVDPRNIVHVSRKCSKLNYKGWKTKRIKIDDMFFFYQDTPIGDISFCPHCVNDNDYETILESFANQFGKRVDDIMRTNKTHHTYD